MIELVTAFDRQLAPGTLATSSSCGHVLRFLAFVFSHVADGAMPLELAASLVAHELAHVWLRAIGVPFPQDTKDDEESRVHQLIAQWGFDEKAFHEWHYQRQGVTAAVTGAGWMVRPLFG